MNISDQQQSDKRPLVQQQKLKVDLQSCLNHLKTTVAGPPQQDSPSCPCCGNKFIKKPLTLCFTSTDISYLGPGLPLYFGFIKLCIAIVAFSTAIVSIPSLYFNWDAKNCQSQHNIMNCSDTLFLKLSVANKISNTSLLNIQSYLVNLNIVVALILLQVGRKLLRNIQLRVTLRSFPSDYAVMLRLPEVFYRQRDIVNCIEQWFKKQKLKGSVKSSPLIFKCKQQFPIKKVLISYDLTTFKQLEKQMEDLSVEIRQNSLRSGSQNMSRKITRIQSIKELIANRSFARNPKCVVIFKYPQQTQFMLSKLKTNPLTKRLGCTHSELIFNGSTVDVSRVPMPGDILWQNHHFKYSKKLSMRIFVKFIAIVSIIVGQTIVFGLLAVWFKYLRHGGYTIQNYVSPLISLSISAINTILFKLLSWITTFQMRPTTLQTTVSIVNKITVSTFMNSGIMLLLAYWLIDIGSIWEYNGFVDTVSYSFLFSILLPQLYKYLNLNIYTNLYYQSKLSKGSNANMTQSQAHRFFERPQMKIYQQYSWSINQLWWASFFSPLVPLGYPCVLLSLAVHYWVQKVNFLHVFRQPKPFGTYLNIQMLKMLEASLFFMGLGNLTLDLVISKLIQTSIPLQVLMADLFGIAIGIGLILTPTELINRFLSALCGQKVNFLNIQYDIAVNNFITTYQKQHPLYRYDTLHKYKVIEDHLQIQMEAAAQQLQATLKKSIMLKNPIKDMSKISNKSSQKDPLSKDSDDCMYSSNQYPTKIQRQNTKHSKSLVPALWISPNPSVREPLNKVQASKAVPFNQVVEGLDDQQKHKVLSKLKNSVSKLS